MWGRSELRPSAMDAMHTYTLLDPQTPDWPDMIDRLYAALGAPGNPALLPAYFVKTSFTRLGGRVLCVEEQQRLIAVGLLVPRAIEEQQPVYTLRLHVAPGAVYDEPAIVAAARALIAPRRLQTYALSGPHHFAPDHVPVGQFDIGAPTAEEAAAIPLLHAKIWQTPPESRFPADIHSVEFGLGTSLVARHEGRLAGFLLGFVSFNLPTALARPAPGIESQTMGIDPAYRRYGLAATLKRRQAHQALARGYQVVHWTADPLQFPNAGLNFGRLRAVAGEFFPNYYPFRNALNRIHPSRLGISWLLDTVHGRGGLSDGAAPIDLASLPDVCLLNAGPEQPRSDPGAAALVALEIPADWTALQRDDPATAQRWRDTTDQVLSAVIGFAPGRYVVTDTAFCGEQRFLIARPYDPALVSPL